MPYRNTSSKDAAHQLNVEFVVQNRLCIGCGVCEMVCPNQAIKMIFDVSYSMPSPHVNNKKCNQCHKCLDVCYGYGVDNALYTKLFGHLPLSITGIHKKCYIGHASDPVLKYRSTSGGVVTALLVHALEQGMIDGAIVTRMEAGNPPQAKAFIATTADEIYSCVGSKYCPVSFAECLKSVDRCKKYAVVGLPCHIYGLRKLAEHRTQVGTSLSLFFGLLCGGMPNWAGTLYLLKSYGMENHYISRLEYRGGGWPGRLLVQKNGSRKNGQAIQIPYPAYWRQTYQFFFPYRCTVCNDGFNELSDLSFGDAWLPHLVGREKGGWSVVIARTDTGEGLVEEASAKNRIRIDPLDIREVTTSQRGLLRFKFSELTARIKLYRALRFHLPMVDSNRALPTRPGHYLSAIQLHVGRTIASKRRLWKILGPYVSASSLLKTAEDFLRILD